MDPQALSDVSSKVTNGLDMAKTSPAILMQQYGTRVLYENYTNGVVDDDSLIAKQYPEQYTKAQALADNPIFDGDIFNSVDEMANEVNNNIDTLLAAGNTEGAYSLAFDFSKEVAPDWLSAKNRALLIKAR
mgnify:CR=1 FL=1